jgi:hypothetical protein
MALADWTSFDDSLSLPYSLLYGWSIRETASSAAVVRIRDGISDIADADAITGDLIDPAAAGNVDDGAHSYKISFVTADGESVPGAQSDPITVVDHSTNGKVVLAVPVSTIPEVTSRILYRTEADADPDDPDNFEELDTIADNTTTDYTDNTADSGLGSAGPTVDQTGSLMLTLAFVGDDDRQAAWSHPIRSRRNTWYVEVVSGDVEGAVYGQL